MSEQFGDESLESLLEYLRDTRSLDFTGYKRPSLTRRIRKRIDAVGAGGFDEYRDLLESDPDEQERLVDTILINVTAFFRDEEAWNFLSAHVVPDILAAAGTTESIRVWSAGCASGEEAYSLAMVLADHLGIDAFKERVKIFATDIDEDALTAARRGVYSERQLEPVSPERRARYFETSPDGFVFRADCRRQVIFGRNDITADAPISRLDLLVCRNVLMYLVTDTQRHVLDRFSYALKPSGYLLLGKAETIIAHADLFDPVSTALRVFRRSSSTRPPGVAALADRVGSPEVLRDLALAATPVAQLVLDVDGRVSGANTKARAMFSVSVNDLDRPFWELDVAHHPVELRPYVEQAYAEGRPVVLHDVSRTLADGQEQFLEVSIAPLSTSAGVDLGVSVAFADVTELGRTRVDLVRSSRDLATANADLLSMNQQLETSNEELQSTNEELETTNEELQSANEELETMNEELQSANDQLQTMNEELLSTADRIEAGQEFLDAILDGLPVAMAITDHRLDLVVWNRAAEHLFGLRTDEAIGRSFPALDIGLPVGEISPLLHAAVAQRADSTTDTPNGTESAASVTLAARDRRGRPFSCRVSVRRIGRPASTDPIVMVLMEPIPDSVSQAETP